MRLRINGSSSRPIKPNSEPTTFKAAGLQTGAYSHFYPSIHPSSTSCLMSAHGGSSKGLQMPPPHLAPPTKPAWGPCRSFQASVDAESFPWSSARLLELLPWKALWRRHGRMPEPSQPMGAHPSRSPQLSSYPLTP